MVLYWDLDLNQLVISAGSRQALGSVSFRLGTIEPLQLRCSRAGVPDALPTGAVPTFGIKPQGEYEANHLTRATAGDWAGPVNGDALNTYTASLDLGVPALVALLSPDTAGSTNVEADDIPLMAEMSAQVPGELRPRATQTLNVDLTNNVNKGTEPPVDGGANTGYPTAAALSAAVEQAAAAPVNLSAVTQRTGGNAASLNSVVTVGQPVGVVVFFTETATSDLVFFRLVSGAAAAGNEDQVAPLDFNAETNNVHFALVPIGTAGASSVISTPRIAYLATDGTDGTAVIGNPAKPFLTPQAAYNAATAITAAGPVVIFVGAGTLAHRSRNGLQPSGFVRRMLVYQQFHRRHQWHRTAGK